MAIQKTEAFVIKTQPFRSSSLIITFFSRDFGKLKGIAKGVRREREMRGALFELFTHLEIIFYEKTRSDLHLVSEASIVDSFDVLRSRLDTISYASYFSELVNALTEVHDSHPAVFSLLEVCFRYLPAISPEKIARLFEIKLLHEIGWLPHLTTCLQCRRARFERGHFSISQGGLVCPECLRHFPDAKPLSPDALAAFRYYAAHDLDEAIKQRISVRAERELRHILERFLLYRLPTPLRTRQFLETVLDPSLAS